ncbi:MAG TPA: hypothetical protein PLZ36_09575, partial [Armatimonadota bacterium]|nr:hypothetical protein [Armatimonadota bacterium]
MALGLSITAPMLPEGFLIKRTPTRQEVLDRLRAGIPALIEDARLRELLWMAVEEETLLVGLHPMEEPVRFAFTGEALRCTARTSGAGPGYHAFLVDLLRNVGQKCRLRWQWEGEDCGDETGYAAHRDFARLQEEMLVWLRAVCAAVVEKAADGATNIGISMPMGYPAVAGDDAPFALTMLGPRTREWVARAATAEGAALQAAGAESFPWWGQAPDEAFWRNTGLALAWVELPWHPPADEQEQAGYQLALACCEYAAATDAQVVGLVKEIHAMTAASQQAPPAPAPAGIGYRRRLLAYELPGLWRITLPGYCYASVDANGEQYCFRHGGRDVTAFTMTMASRSENAASEERLLQNMKALSSEDELHKFQRGTLLGRAAVGRTEEGWSLLGYVAASNNMAVVYIACPDEDDVPWALGVWQS